MSKALVGFVSFPGSLDIIEHDGTLFLRCRMIAGSKFVDRVAWRYIRTEMVTNGEAIPSHYEASTTAVPTRPVLCCCTFAFNNVQDVETCEWSMAGAQEGMKRTCASVRRPPVLRFDLWSGEVTRGPFRMRMCFPGGSDYSRSLRFDASIR